MKKTLLLTFLCACFSIQAQFLNYTNIAQLPEPRTCVDAAAYNGKIYIAGGSNFNTVYSNVLVYDVANNSYAKLDLAELGGVRYVNIEVSGNKIYVFNGQKTDGTVNPYIWIYDTTTGNFSIQQNPYSSRNAGSVVNSNGDIYFFGGANADESIFYNRLVKYTPSTGQFTLMANMPTAIETKGEIVGNYLYTFGGYNGSVSSAVYEYNLTENLWQTLNTTVSGGISAHTVTTDGSRLFLTGDFTNLTNNKIYEAQNNASYDVYDTTQSGMVGRRHHASVIVNDKLYIFGGNTASDVLTSAQVANLPMNIGMIGVFTQWSYDVPMTTTNGVNYFYGAGSTPMKYTFSNNTEFKFRRHNDWNYAWSSNSFPTGVGFQAGDVINVPSGSYYIYFNRNTGAYNFSTTLLSSNEMNGKKELSFYPNPAKDKVTFSEDIKEIKVYDMSGKEINVSVDKNEISVSRLSNGNYLMKITTLDGNSFTKNLIKK